MQVVWNILAANGTYSQNFTYNTDGSIEDININEISYAFYSDTKWTTPVAAPTAGTVTWTGQHLYPNGEVSNIPVALTGSPPSTPTNIADFSVAGTADGFTFAGKCMFFSIVVAGISNTVKSMQIIISRYSGGV